MSNGFNEWQKAVVVAGPVGLIATGVYGLRYSLVLEFNIHLEFALPLSTVLLGDVVMCRNRNCDKNCPFNLKRKREESIKLVRYGKEELKSF